MNRRSWKCIVVFLVTVLPSALFAQDLEASQADTLYGKAAYFLAIDYYKKAITKATDTVLACRCKKQLAKCYTMLNDLTNANLAYKDIIQTCKTDLRDLKNFARILQKDGEYEKAKRIYSSCYQADTSDLFSYESMYFCDTVKQAIDRISEVYLENVHHVNSMFDDVINEVNNDTLYFLSARKGKRTEKKSLSHNQYSFKMYRSNDAIGKRVELNPQPFGDGFTATDLEGNEIYFSKTEPLLKDPFSSRTAIYRAKRHFSGFSDPQKFGFDNDSSAFGHPNLSPDGNLFFFVSDMPGGFGGMDIYMCMKLGNKWSAPINLGREVNSVDNELFPFYFGQGVLFFSSNGRAGFGGYDVYTTVLKKEKWTKATNLSVPVNSKADDMAMRCDKTKKIFYLSSNRPKGKGGLDVYKVHQFKISEFRKTAN